ncbi:MAG: arginine--tRNA ligase [Candidatus Levybacteria bacterium]|nr:arginine--tRNA ligase [Candidatus Levybacteria bacterium]
MKTIKQQIITAISEIAPEDLPVNLDHPVQEEHGDYASNIALIAAKYAKKPPMEIAESLAKQLLHKLSKDIKILVAAPGFINFTLPENLLLEKMQATLAGEYAFQPGSKRVGKKVMVEYAHPNTHKEMHIGHMRTLITGEAICRLLEATGARVFRANYQGDIGPHVAKAIWGIKKIMAEKGLELAEVEGWTDKDKAHFLGEGYVRGSQEYEANKEEIDQLNSDLYVYIHRHSGKRSDSRISNNERSWTSQDDDIASLYEITRQWSLDYYEDFYQRFYTTFDRLFFESEMVEAGKKIVNDNLGKVFVEDNGAIIFPGEKYGLHTRVFITQAGNPTYEGKEMANGFSEYETFPFDMKIHVVGSEQAGYFQVVFKALELIDPEKFKDKQHHISMGMVQLTDRKMSSRTGDILTVDWLIDQVKERIEKLVAEGKIAAEDRERVTEQVAIGAIKYSVLKVGTGQNVAFDIAKSVSLDGDSGPYLQYTYARTQSVLRKSQTPNSKSQINTKYKIQNTKYQSLEPEELSVLRVLYRFDEVVTEAADTLSPHLLAGYLFDLAQKFNLFYQKHKILPTSPVILRTKSEKSSDRSFTSVQDDRVSEFRLTLTTAVGNTIKQGLDLLGIQAPEKM